jgi:hypothetical protein
MLLTACRYGSPETNYFSEKYFCQNKIANEMTKEGFVSPKRNSCFAKHLAKFSPTKFSPKGNGSVVSFCRNFGEFAPDLIWTGRMDIQQGYAA